MGEGKEAALTTSPSVQTAYTTMMWIIIVGWAIYPAGYVFGYLMGSVDASSLNLIYNLADFVNKILFGSSNMGCSGCKIRELPKYPKISGKEKKRGLIALFFLSE